MQFFVRSIERHKDSARVYAPEVACAALGLAEAEARRQVLESRPEQMLEADACLRNGGHVVTKYRCRLDANGELHEFVLR